MRAVCYRVDDRPDQSVARASTSARLGAPVVEILFCPRHLKLVPGTHRNCGTDRGYRNRGPFQRQAFAAIKELIRRLPPPPMASRSTGFDRQPGFFW